MDDPRGYIHLDGRVGHVGQMGQMGSIHGSGGRVVCILKEDEAAKMETLADKLGLEFNGVHGHPQMTKLNQQENHQLPRLLATMPLLLLIVYQLF
jgi:superfamily II DNA/RNA helicase